MTKPALDSMLLQFCLVRTRYILLRLSSLLFCYCSRTIGPIVALFFSGQLLGLSALCVFLQEEKRVGWNTLARKYIFHLCMTQGKLKILNKETNQLFKKFCCLPYHVFPASIGAIYTYLFLPWVVVLRASWHTSRPKPKKTKNNHPEKNSSYFRKWNPLALIFKNFLYFLIF